MIRKAVLIRKSFERKLLLLKERCDRANIVEQNMSRAFSIMLTEKAQQYYFDYLKI